MVREYQYTKEQLLDVMNAYLIQIERNGKEYPAVVLDDIKKSIRYVLEKNRYKR